MCLTISKSATRHILGRMKSSNKIICYKVLTNSNFAMYKYMKYKGGWNYSNRTSIEMTYDEERLGEIIYGIHVYTSKKKAMFTKNEFSYIRKIVPVICYKKDFVSAGIAHDAVFTKIFVPKKNLTFKKNKV